MGIKGVWPYLKSIHPNIFTKVPTYNYNHISIDVNITLHQNIWKNTSNIHKCVIQSLDDILWKYRPCKTIFLCLDGPNSLGKLLLQRKRRFSREYSKVSSSNMITPGTIFMNQFDDALTRFASDLPITKISCSYEHGESDLKITNHLQSLQLKYEKDEKALVMTCDGDMVLQLLASNAYLYTDIWDPTTQLYISIHDWIMELSNELQTEPRILSKEISFICLLLGTDCTPKLIGTSFKYIMTSFIKWKKETRLSIFTCQESVSIPHYILFLESMIRLNVFKLGTEKNSNLYMESILWMYQVFTYCLVPDYYTSYHHVDDVHIKTLLHYLRNLEMNEFKIEPPCIVNQHIMEPDVVALLMLPPSQSDLLDPCLHPFHKRWNQKLIEYEQTKNEPLKNVVHELIMEYRSHFSN